MQRVQIDRKECRGTKTLRTMCALYGLCVKKFSHDLSEIRSIPEVCTNFTLNELSCFSLIGTC